MRTPRRCRDAAAIVVHRDLHFFGPLRQPNRDLTCPCGMTQRVVDQVVENALDEQDIGHEMDVLVCAANQDRNAALLRFW